MAERLLACSHYCDHLKGTSYSPKDAAGKDTVQFAQELKRKIRGSLTTNKLGSFVYAVARKFYRMFLYSKISHDRFYSNNNLGIFITTSCNLSCSNCQTSARRAPASDMMSVEQMEKIVQEAIDLKYFWSQIFVTGGEPTLHPQFFELLDILKKYKDFNPECDFFLETNGVGVAVQSALKKLPDWISAHNSNKSEGKKDYTFFTYNVAPIDTLLDRFSDFSKGCSRLTSCYGLCATMYGYYPCSPCMNVARVFGFDVGIQGLPLVTEKTLREQMRVLCKYCGWFKEQHNKVAVGEPVSKSWEKAFAEYKKQKPKLTLYG